LSKFAEVDSPTTRLEKQEHVKVLEENR
jgi:hypothetical protein